MNLKRQRRRRRILGWWLLSQIFLTTVTAFVSSWLEVRAMASDAVNAPSTDTLIDMMTALFTVGLVSSVIWPTTWVSLLCLAAALWRRRYWPLFVAAFCAVIYGFFWPLWMSTMMSA